MLMCVCSSFLKLVNGLSNKSLLFSKYAIAVNLSEDLNPPDDIPLVLISMAQQQLFSKTIFSLRKKKESQKMALLESNFENRPSFVEESYEGWHQNGAPKRAELWTTRWLS